MTGPSWVFSQKVNDYLSEPYIMGASYSPTNLGIQAGGEGFAMIHRVLIGGGGYGISQFTQSADSASLVQGSGGGYFKVGYVFWSKQKTFMTTNLGIGGFGSSYEITNQKSKNGIYFNEEFPIRTGETKTYSYAGSLFDFTYGIKTLITGKNMNSHGGFMLGFDAGCLLNVATGSWSGDEDNIIGPPSPGVTTIPYIRLTIGGGGFSTSQ